MLYALLEHRKKHTEKAFSIIKKQIMKTWFKTFPKNIYHILDLKFSTQRQTFSSKKSKKKYIKTHRMSETSVIYHLPQNLKYN